jgi:uncharacterized protein
VNAPANVMFDTSDGVHLFARHWDVGVRRLGCVVAHGFTGSSHNRHVERICRALAGTGAGVLCPDLRGHGRSGGLSTAGDAEVRDVAAAVTWLRQHEYQRVAVLGWSMGGSAVLRYAGLGGDADAVVSVSSPGEWFERGTRSMRIVHWMCETRSGRLVTRAGRHTRLARGWDVVPPAPAQVAGAIAPTPLLIVHGDADRYFPLRHVELLAAIAPGATVWIEAGMGHAETATTTELLGRIAVWVGSAVSPSTATEQIGAGDVCDDGARE